MHDENQPPIILEPADAADACVIWLHGLGADGGDFEPVVDALGLPPDHRVRFVFPHAPIRPITINQGYRMRGWYDITSLDIAKRDDEDGIAESSRLLASWCDDQVDGGIDSKRIIVAGFSQGGAIALYGGLRYHRRLAGIIALSTYLPLKNTLPDEADAANRGIPIFMGHGMQDDVVTFEYGVDSRDLLRQAGYAVEWHEYPMPHSVNMDEIADIGVFLCSHLT